MEPTLELAVNHGLKKTELIKIEMKIRENQDEIKAAWEKHFG
ncbi:MAG: DUF4160 domain-containing protein [Verrucomicrobiota bacterium]|nr:DUF4160 domain-containing protein [Verrucomicrobiota bacterium]